MGANHWLTPKIGPGILIFSALVAISFLPWAAAMFKTSRARRWPLPVGALLVAAAWMITEAVRSWQSLGGPWGLFGATQWNNRVLLKLAALGGVWLVSFFLVAVNWCIATAIRRRGERGSLVSTAAVLAVGLGAAALTPGPSESGGLHVAGVQPGPGLGAGPRLESQVELTLGLSGPTPDVVVWGESSLGIGIEPDSQTLADLSRLSDEVGAPILVNVDARRGEGGIFKSSTLVDRDGVVGTYDKMRMVPFGEYIPFRRALGWLSAVSEAAAEDRRRGERIRPLTLGSLSIGPLVCFESAFPDMGRTLTRMGADVIVYQSATSTFQDSWAPEQHASLAALRAVETGRPVVHATLTGASTIYDATGRELTSLATSKRGTYSATVPLTTGTTPYVRWGDWVLLLSFLIVAGWATQLLRQIPGRMRTSRRVENG
jgi:apolipoprotein N-acyltransferase